MSEFKQQHFTLKRYLKAAKTRNRTAKQKAVVALWSIVEDMLYDRMERDGMCESRYDFQSVEAFVIDSCGKVHLAYIGSYEFEQPIEELLTGFEDGPGILALLKRPTQNHPTLGAECGKENPSLEPGSKQCQCKLNGTARRPPLSDKT